MNEYAQRALSDSGIGYETPEEVERQRPVPVIEPRRAVATTAWTLHSSPELQDVLIACTRLAAAHLEHTGRLLPGLLFGRGTIIFEQGERKKW